MCSDAKEKIAEAVEQMMLTKPVSKITVQSVMEQAQMKRQTFYYHYQDIYALLEEIVVTKAKKLFVLDEDNLENSWKSNLRFMGQYGKKNENFIRNLYQSMGRDAFGDQLLEISYGSIYRSVQAYAEKEMVQNPDITYKEQAIKDTSYILAKMLSENAVEWIRGRVEQDPVALMEKAIATVDGVGRVLLNNLNQIIPSGK